VPGAILFILLLAFVITYNRLVTIKNQCTEAWSNVETELQRRYDLIPNLVQTVKGYAQHEHQLLEEITRLRETCAANHGSPAQQAETENALMGALDRLNVRIEAYPDLKANQNFLELQRELSNTEDRIQASRRFYNGNVRDNNNLIQMFPSNIIAGMFSFQMRQYFELRETAAREPVTVNL
jgi:LemA protein